MNVGLVGRDSPPGRDREALRPGDCPATSLLAAHGGRGARAGAASRARSRQPRQPAWTRTWPRSTPCWPSIPTSRRCASTRRLPAAPMATPAARSPSAATCGRSGPHAVASTRKSTTSRPRRCRSIGASAAACQVGNTTRKVSVFVAVLCYSRMIYIEFTLSQRKAEFYRGLVQCPGLLWRQSPRHHLRQLESGRAQRLGPRRLFPSRVPGAVRLLLPAADRLRTARSRIQRNRRGEACAT